MDGFVRVAGTADIPDPGSRVVEVDGEAVALFHVEGAYHAIDDVCTHDGGPLASGELSGHKVACPRHGARFDIRTGAALSMPAVRATRSHEVRIADGGVWVRLRSAAGSTGPAPVASAPRPLAPPAPAPAAPHPAAAIAATATTGTAGASPAAPAAAPLPAGPLCEEQVRELLKAVKDPELFVNIVDLGLIYAVALSPSAEAPGKQQVAIDMTMTSPACPAGPQLIADTKRTLAAHPEVTAVEVRIVMDPPWTPDRMTDDARDQLGIF
jgi:metal-sulfur cluster biosynthetic enzyme/nitrite reductase/ring-hydroxylating ferredoxin subunit